MGDQIYDFLLKKKIVSYVLEEINIKHRGEERTMEFFELYFYDRVVCIYKYIERESM